jgi:uncharacterized protein YkwD
MRRRLQTLLIIAVTAAAAAQRLDADGANGGKSGIYSLSAHESFSRVLGVNGVPAYVTIRGNSRRGLYITSMAPGGNWRALSLQPGDVLISIDNHVISDARQADSELSGLPAGMRNITMARKDDDGVPEIFKYRAQIIPAAADRSDRNGSGSRPSLVPDAGPAVQNHSESIPALESYVVDLINHDRVAAGLPQVSVSAALSALARDYAEYAAARHIFAHVDDQGRSPQERAQQHGIRAGVYENLARHAEGFNDRGALAGAHKIMMAEPIGQENHRSNLMGAARQFVGVGVARAGRDLMLVEEFTDVAP